MFGRTMKNDNDAGDLLSAPKSVTTFFHTKHKSSRTCLCPIRNEPYSNPNRRSRDCRTRQHVGVRGTSWPRRHHSILRVCHLQDGTYVYHLRLSRWRREGLSRRPQIHVMGSDTSFFHSGDSSGSPSLPPAFPVAVYGPFEVHEIRRMICGSFIMYTSLNDVVPGVHPLQTSHI